MPKITIPDDIKDKMENNKATPNTPPVLCGGLVDLERKIKDGEIGVSGVSSWNDLEDKPDTFPPSEHKHQIGDVEGIVEAFDSKADINHTHDNYLEVINGDTTEQLQITDTLVLKTKDSDDKVELNGNNGLNVKYTNESVEHNVIGLNGTTNKLNIGSEYDTLTLQGKDVRPTYNENDLAFKSDIIDPDWENITNKPTEFEPKEHKHTYESITEKPTQFPPEKHNHIPSEVGLGNVTNDAQVKRSEMGVANGVATLNANGKVVDSQLSEFALKIYPIGSIYLSVVNTNPSSFIGGTWERFGKGRTLVGVDENDANFNTVKKTGGHKELQSHIHTMAHTHTWSGTTSSSGSHNHSASSSSGGAHTHSVSGTAASGGTHCHTVRYGSNGPISSGNPSCIMYGWGGGLNPSGTALWDRAVQDAGAHTHSVSATASSAGSHSHTITVNSGGAHTHTVSGTTGAASNTTTTSAGTGNAGNLQPYITTYMWVRTA